MANKLKEIFSDDSYNFDGTLHFRDNTAYRDFLSALEIVQTEGRVVPVDGVTSVTTKISHQGAKFPLEEHSNISEFFIGPSVEEVPVQLNVNGCEKTLTLLRSRTKDKALLWSNPNSVVSFSFVLIPSENKHTISYRIQFEKAETVEDLADSFGLAAALLTKFYKPEDNEPKETGKVSISDLKKYFHCFESFFRRLIALEKELDLSIAPELLSNIPSEEQQTIDELYLLLCERKVVRLNAKLTSTDSTMISMNQNTDTVCVGSPVMLTILNTMEFHFLQQTAILHTANLLADAVIKEIRESPDGSIKILYGDTDSKPMYIAFSAFKTPEEAKQELDSLMQHIDTYENAQTSNVYIRQFYSDEQ